MLATYATGRVRFGLPTLDGVSTLSFRLFGVFTAGVRLTEILPVLDAELTPAQGVADVLLVLFGVTVT